jgi:hypothetical protein
MGTPYKHASIRAASVKAAAAHQPLFHEEEPMTPFSDDQIRDRARALWEQAGQPENQDMEFWLLAEQQLAEETAGDELEPDGEVTPAFAAAALSAIE